MILNFEIQTTRNCIEYLLRSIDIIALHCTLHLLWLVQPQVSLLVHYHLHVLHLVGQLPGNLIFPLVYVLGRHRIYSGYQNLLLHLHHIFWLSKSPPPPAKKTIGYMSVLVGHMSVFEEAQGGG